jgi:hypothetical protein
MHRRAVLKSVFSTFAGAGLLHSARAASAPPSETQTPTSKTKGQPTSFLTTSDGTALFYRDWGAGSPLVFLAPLGAALRLVGIPNGFLIRARAALHCL